MKHADTIYGQSYPVFALYPFVGHHKVNGREVSSISELYGGNIFRKTAAEFI